MFELHNIDCLEYMRTMPEKSVDAILTDLPYGTTACAWDSIIPFEPMWEAVKHVLKSDGVFVTTASQPFTTMLIASNFQYFKYCWVWVKNFSTNFLHAKTQPLRKTEDVVIWQYGSPVYNPIKTLGHVPTQSAKGSSKGRLWHGKNKRNYVGGHTDRFPTNVLYFDAVDPKKRINPTQKPVALYKYLVQTYTNPGDTVLDMCMGSGTTGIACIELDRYFIGCEIDKKYFEVVKKRIEDAAKQGLLPLPHNNANAAEQNPPRQVSWLN